MGSKYAAGLRLVDRGNLSRFVTYVYTASRAIERPLRLDAT